MDHDVVSKANMVKMKKAYADGKRGMPGVGVLPSATQDGKDKRKKRIHDDISIE